MSPGAARAPIRRLDVARPCLVMACLLLAAFSRAGDARAHLRRGDLVGAWQLVGMRYTGSDGTHVDPFYQPGSIGLLIYDRSGWMSVQISAPLRKAHDVPADRTVPGEAAGALDKAAAFDTYYAYYGTWSLDPTTVTVTHHVTDALIAAESGRDYAQFARLDHGRLVLTTRTGPPGHETVREKLWERAKS